MNEVKEMRRLMEKTGANTADAARALGVSWQTFNRWIRGKHSPSPVCRRILRAEIERLKAGAD